MVRYLSPEWIDRLRAEAVRDETLAEAAAGLAMTLQQEVTGAPGGDAHYYVTFDDGDVYVQAGRAEAPDVTFSQSYGTAVAVATGKLNALEAFRDGHVRLTGDPSVLRDAAPAVTALDGVFATVRAETEYPDRR